MQNYDNYKIIIVDNYSNNGSVENLKTRYLNNSKVDVVALEKNYGFAKGNDVGYFLAKFKYNADYIVVMNNDVIIEDRNFCKKLLAVHKNHNVGIIGPDIENLTGIHQNPLWNCITNKKELVKAIWTIRLKLTLMPFLYQKKPKCRHIKTYSPFIKDEMKNVPLHGSCIIFTKAFIDVFNYAFYPDTFLYAEEDILFYLSQKNKINSMYCPSLNVKHMEDVSTNNICKNGKEKRMFELKNSLASLKVLRQIWKEQ